MKIKTLPPVLLLHLKRFKYQEELQKYVKLSYRVAFPLELRLYNNTVDPTSADIGPEGRGRRRTPHDFGDGAAGQEEAKGAGSGGPGDPEGLYRLFAVVVHIGGCVTGFLFFVTPVFTSRLTPFFVASFTFCFHI